MHFHLSYSLICKLADDITGEDTKTVHAEDFCFVVDIALCDGFVSLCITSQLANHDGSVAGDKPCSSNAASSVVTTTASNLPHLQ